MSAQPMSAQPMSAQPMSAEALLDLFGRFRGAGRYNTWETMPGQAIARLLADRDHHHARAEEAEAEAAKLRADRRASGLRGLLADAEAENERLRAEVEQLKKTRTIESIKVDKGVGLVLS